MRGCWNWLVIVALALFAQGAWAHRYIPNDGSHLDWERALDVGDITISTVAYHTLEDGKSQLWLRFDAEAGQTASIQIGVPFIERYEVYRPAFVLLGPDMPALDVPFAISEGYGGMVYTTDDVAEPDVFHEEFTGATSWTFDRQEVNLPATGRYYIESTHIS